MLPKTAFSLPIGANNQSENMKLSHLSLPYYFQVKFQVPIFLHHLRGSPEQEKLVEHSQEVKNLFKAYCCHFDVDGFLRRVQLVYCFTNYQITFDRSIVFLGMVERGSGCVLIFHAPDRTRQYLVTRLVQEFEHQTRNSDPL